MAFIGVDLHTNSFTVCRLEGDGSEHFETFTLGQMDLDRFCDRLDANDELAVEATGNSAWFCGEVRPCVGRVVVVNPRQFQVIRKSVKKNGQERRACIGFLFIQRHAAGNPPEKHNRSGTGFDNPQSRCAGQAAHHAAQKNSCDV